MRFESQTHPQDDHVDRITDCSTRYGQAPAVCTRVSLAKGRCHSPYFIVLANSVKILQVKAIVYSIDANIFIVDMRAMNPRRPSPATPPNIGAPCIQNQLMPDLFSQEQTTGEPWRV